MKAPFARTAGKARGVFLLLALTTPACDSPSVVRPVSAPASVPPALKDGTVSGTVFEHRIGGARRAAAGIRVRLQHLQKDGGGTIDTTSDASGQYEFVDVPTRSAVIVAPPLDSGYRAPCPFGTDAYDGAGMRVDVHVVPTSVLITTGMPSSVPTYVYTVSGTVSGPSGGLGGASVELANFGPETLSATLTGPLGTFALCAPPPNVGADQDIEVKVRKEGYQPLTHVVNLGWAGPGTLRLALIPE